MFKEECRGQSGSSSVTRRAELGVDGEVVVPKQGGPRGHLRT